jgi:hypothetical protein
MARRIGRWAGWLLLVLAVAAAAYDGTVALRSGAAIHVSTLGDLWARLHQASLTALESEFQRLSPWLWDHAVARMLGWQGWAAFGAPGAVLAWLFRRRRAHRRHRR